METPARIATKNVIRNMLNKNAKSWEGIISDKFRQERAKSKKYKDSFMIHTRQAKKSLLVQLVNILNKNKILRDLKSK